MNNGWGSMSPSANALDLLIAKENYKNYFVTNCWSVNYNRYVTVT